jgi:hypothetical protein
MNEIVNIADIGALEDAKITDGDPPRIFHERDDPFETLSDRNFPRTFRLSKNLVADLIENIEPFVRAPSRLSTLDVTTKVSQGA